MRDQQNSTRWIVNRVFPWCSRKAEAQRVSEKKGIRRKLICLAESRQGQSSEMSGSAYGACRQGMEVWLWKSQGLPPASRWPTFRQASVGRSDVSPLNQLDGIPSTHTNDLQMVPLRDTSVMACSLSYDTKANRVHWKNFIHGNETFSWLIRILHSNRNKKEGVTMHLR